MTLNTQVQVRGFVLNDAEERRIERQLRSLEPRLAESPEPVADLILEWHPDQRTVDTTLRVRLGHLGGHFVSRTSAETADHATRLAVDDIKRQIERHMAILRGEPEFGKVSPPPAPTPESPPTGSEQPENSEAEQADEEPGRLSG